jgi:CRISPR type I-E-associated protein CasB/Cse2
VTATEEYVAQLAKLKPGKLALLRTHAGRGLDETVDGFDLFTGLWWPLRGRNERAPRRQVAWLIAKLYALNPIEHSPGKPLACQLRQCQPGDNGVRNRFRCRFDEMLALPIDQIEPALQWALDRIGFKALKLDWVSLTDDLSKWERASTRLRWAEEFLKRNKEDSYADRNSHGSEPQPGQP